MSIKTKMLSVFLSFILVLGYLTFIPSELTFALNQTTKPGTATSHWFNSPVRVGIDVAQIDGEDVVKDNLPAGVYAYAIPGKNGGAPSVDPTQIYAPVSIEAYLSDMAERNINRYNPRELEATMSNLMFNLPDIRDIESLVSELRSYGLGGDIGKYSIGPTEEYLDMLISKNTYSTSSQLQKGVLAAVRGMEVPTPTIGIVYDKAGMSMPALHKDGFYYYGPITVSASGYTPKNNLGFKLIKFETNAVDSGAELVRVGDIDTPIKVNATEVVQDEELFIKIKDSSYVESLDLEFSFKHYERATQIYKAQQSNGMYLASPYFKEVTITSAESFGSLGLKGSLVIRRFDLNGQPINGGLYSLKTLTKGNSFPEKTGLQMISNGELLIEDLPAGQYEVWEDTPPSGLLSIKSHQFFEIFEDGQIVYKEFRGDKFTVPVTVKLIDADTGEPIMHGGSASIFNVDTKETIATGLFSPTGLWSCELPQGNYAVQAGESPDRYFFVDYANPKYFTITDENDKPEITLDARLVKGSVTLHVKEWMDTPAVSGALFYLYDANNGQRITKYDTLLTDTSGIIKIPAIEYGKYYLVQQPFPEYSSYIPDTTPIYFNIYGKGYVNDSSQYVTEGTNFVYTHENKLKRGTVEISVVDEEGTIVDGVEFSIFRKTDSSNVLWSQFTSGGQTTFYNLEPDTYIIKWTNRLAGFIYDSTELEAVIRENGDFIQLTFPSLRYKRGTVIATKVDAITSAPIRDVFFVIVDDMGNEVARSRTGDDGRAITKNLKVGNYRIQEVQENEKYNPNRSYTPFTISEHGQAVSLTFKESIKTGDLTILAVDANRNPIQGARFKVLDMSNNVVATGTTDINGELIIRGLTYNEYNIFNDSIPAKYQPLLTPVKFAIANTGDSIVKEFVFASTTGTITIIKRDAQDRKPLAFAEFSLYDYTTGNHILNAVSDSNGYATFRNVPYGRYYVIEVKASPGYQLNTEVIGGGQDMTAPSDGWPIGYTGYGRSASTGEVIDKLLGVTTVYAAGGGILINEQNQNVVIDGNTIVTKPTEVDSDNINTGLVSVYLTPYDKNSSANKMLLCLIDDTTSTVHSFKTVDVNNLATFTDVPYGRYVVQVVNYPTTWRDRIQATSVNITADSKDIKLECIKGSWNTQTTTASPSDEGTISVGHKIYGSALIYVKANDATPISNSSVDLYSADTNQIISTYTTNIRGEILIDPIYYGKYYIRQRSSDTTYAVDTSIHTLNIEDQGKQIEIFITNNKLDTVNDKNTLAIEGVLAKDDGDGSLTSTDLGMGGYRVTLLDYNYSFITSTYTDEYGSYKFNIDTSGIYIVRFDLPVDYFFISSNTLTNTNGYRLVNVEVEAVSGINALISDRDLEVEPPSVANPITPSPVQNDVIWVDVPIPTTYSVKTDSSVYALSINNSSENIVYQEVPIGKTGFENRVYYSIGNNTNGNPAGLPDTGDRGIHIPLHILIPVSFAVNLIIISLIFTKVKEMIDKKLL